MKKCTDPRIPMDPQEAIKVLDTKLNIEGPIAVVRDEIRARMTGVEALKKQIPMGRPAQFDSDSINCGSCDNDIEDAMNNGFYYCPFCGQKLKD